VREDTLPSQSPLLVVRAWLWLIVPSVVLGAAIAFGVASLSSPTYTSQVTLLVTTPSTASGISASDIQVDQAFAQTYADLVTTRPLLARAISAANLPTSVDAVAQHVSARVPVGDTMVVVTVSYSDPAGSAVLANEIATELLNYPPDAKNKGFGSNVELTVVDPAIPPKTPGGLHTSVAMALGGAIGLLLSVSVAFLVENIRNERRQAVARRVLGRRAIGDSGSPIDP
jgi:capsular polysaccharide biosynthesis protein